MNNENAKEFLTIEESAAALGVCYATLYRLIKKNKIETVRIGGRVKIARAELMRAITQNTGAQDHV